ncbi:MAG: DUF86 domain-containing protein [Deltaproteobacteria bacterium]|nr:DUF86 domain-containing protein [Deltaproteobacteria bacterium]
MVQAETARKLLAVLLDNLGDLRRYRGAVTRERLRTERDVQHMVLHAIYLATQSAVDLALHLGADAGLAQAGSYADAFHRLADAGFLDRALAARLAGWAGLRNVLAHFYPVVDYDRVHDALAEIGDLEAFAVLVAREVER